MKRKIEELKPRDPRRITFRISHSTDFHPDEIKNIHESDLKIFIEHHVSPMLATLPEEISCVVFAFHIINNRVILLGYCLFEKKSPRRISTVRQIFVNSECDYFDSALHTRGNIGFDHSSQISKEIVFGTPSQHILQQFKNQDPIYPFSQNHDVVCQYFAGFFDGDGSIFYDGDIFAITVVQSQVGPNPPQILSAFKSFFGFGKISLDHNGKDNQQWNIEDKENFIAMHEIAHEVGQLELQQTVIMKLDHIEAFGKYRKRPTWKWRVRTELHVGEFLKKISPFCVVKKPQMIRALEFLTKRAHKNIPFEAQEEIKKEFSRKSGMKQQSFYQAVPVDDTALTASYIAGIFDAEGCIETDPDGTIGCHIAQTSNITLLAAIRKKIKIGISNNKEWRCHTKEFYDVFAPLCVPFLIEKKIEVQLCLDSTTTEWRKKIKPLLSILKKD